MDITDNVNSIVQSIVAQITDQVQKAAMVAIQEKIADVVDSIDSTALLANLLNQKLDSKLAEMPIDTKSIESKLTTKIDSLSTAISQAVLVRSQEITAESINAQIGQINFNQLCQSTLLAALQQQVLKFPEASIPGNAIDPTNWLISGNNVSGGIIQNFGSTGIDDKATACQLSIFNDVTVVENNLLTRDLTVKGTTTIEGDLNVTGTLPESSPLFQNVVRAASDNVRTSLNQGIFQGYADLVTAQLQSTGIDLTKITIQGQEIINGNTLGNSITQSNLQKVGQLNELQVVGESFLSGTLYTTSTRVGVNTIEPAQALSIWDQEIEIGFGKQTAGTAVIETPRSQSLVLSSNGQNNLTLTPDGATTVNKINMGTMSFTAGSMPPSDNQPKGSIVFNSNPSLGGPLGWVSLGDARWANFGIID
jgi:hypothetical protein